MHLFEASKIHTDLKERVCELNRLEGPLIISESIQLLEGRKVEIMGCPAHVLPLIYQPSNPYVPHHRLYNHHFT